MAQEWKEYLNRLNTASTEVFAENTDLKEQVQELKKEGENWRKEKLDLLKTQGELLDKLHVQGEELKESKASSEQAQNQVSTLRSKLEAETEGKRKLEEELDQAKKENSNLRTQLKEEVEALLKKLQKTFEERAREEEAARKSFQGTISGIILAGISVGGALDDGGGRKRTQPDLHRDEQGGGDLGEVCPSKRARSSYKDHQDGMGVTEDQPNQANSSNPAGGNLVRSVTDADTQLVEPLLDPVDNILYDDVLVVLDDVKEHGIGVIVDKDIDSGPDGDSGSPNDVGNDVLKHPSKSEVDPACDRSFNLLLQIPLGDLLGDRNLLFVFPSIFSIQDVAHSILSRIGQTEANEEMVQDDRLSKSPLPLRLATLLAIIRKLSNLYPAEYEDLPREFGQLFCQKLVDEDEGSDWMENEELMNNLGGFFAAIHTLFGGGAGVVEIILTVGGVKGPLLYSFLHGLLQNDGGFGVLGYKFGVTKWAALSLWVRSILIIVFRCPNYNNSAWKGRLTELLSSKGMEDLIPQGTGFNGFFELVTWEVCLLDSQPELLKAAKVVGMMAGHRGWAWFKEVAQVLLNRYDMLFREGKVSERGFGEGILKGFGHGIAWLRRENLPENLGNVKSQFVRFREARYPQIIRDSANCSIALMEKMVLRSPNQTPISWEYIRKDGGRRSNRGSLENKPIMKDSAEKPKKKKMPKRQTGGGITKAGAAWVVEKEPMWGRTGRNLDDL